MSFASIAYLLFLPIVWSIYWLLRNRQDWQNLLLLVASYVFYGWLNWRIVPLFFFISMIAYGTGLLLDKDYSKSIRKTIVWTASLLILSNLAVFKYYNFFTENFALLLNHLGMKADLPTLHLILPIGISFYTFQALGYIIDVYRRQQKPAKDVIAFLTFISFFPQLVAGPIERAKDLLPQIERKRSVDYPGLVAGSRQILWGLFKKMVIADNCAVAANEIWNQYQDLSGLTLLVGALLFSFQIYCDFSGYSDIAIGSARLFGIRLSQNFNYPYYATSIADFWRRWNMTLMSWFRDYIYIPLGGNRCSKLKNIRNTWAVFLVSGLWHGANWTFVVWGIYHAILLVPRTLLKGVKRAWYIPKSVKILVTFFLVTIGWILFRAPSIIDAFNYASSISLHGPISCGKEAVLYCALFLIVEWIGKNRDMPRLRRFFQYRPCRWAVYYLGVMAILLLRGEAQTFIYFQF